MLDTGTLRMIREYKAKGFKSTKWENRNNILELTFSGVNHQYEGINEGLKLNIEGVNEELELLYMQIAKNPQSKANELNEQI